MLDIYLSMALMLALGAAAGLLAARLVRGRSVRVRLALMALAVAGIVAYMIFLYDRMALARVLPLSSLVVVGNPLPVFVGAVIGLVWGAAGVHMARAIPLLTALVAVVIRVVYVPLLRHAPECRDEWRDGVCIQTTQTTCGAAAAAALLKQCGMPATEAEMAGLCLTSPEGTLGLGMYRGLLRKTAGTPWTVQVFEGDEDALRSLGDGPAILFVGLRRGQRADPRYAGEWGWTPGLRHTVVLFGFRDEYALEIGDPSIGRERWSVEALDVLWDGTALRLVKR
jgi:hypothetical protein